MCADRRRALIGRVVISHRSGTVTTGVFAGIAEAAGIAATTPFAAYCVTSVSDGGKRSRVRQAVAVGC